MSSLRLEKYGKLSKGIGKVTKSILHPQSAIADREMAREAEEEKMRAEGGTPEETDEARGIRQTLSDFRRDILYGRRRSGTGQGFQRLAQNVTSSDSKGEHEAK